MRSQEQPEAHETPETTAEDVLSFLRLCDSLDVGVWLDGGWAAYALLQRQTRSHEDLDIVIERRHVTALVDALRSGFGRSRQ